GRFRRRASPCPYRRPRRPRLIPETSEPRLGAARSREFWAVRSYSGGRARGGASGAGAVVAYPVSRVLAAPPSLAAAARSPAVGWPARTTQRQAIAIGTKAIRKTEAETRGQPHFVHPPSSCESAMTSPAPATSPTLVQ